MGNILDMFFVVLGVMACFVLAGLVLTALLVIAVFGVDILFNTGCTDLGHEIGLVQALLAGCKS